MDFRSRGRVEARDRARLFPEEARLGGLPLLLVKRRKTTKRGQVARQTLQRGLEGLDGLRPQARQKQALPTLGQRGGFPLGPAAGARLRIVGVTRTDLPLEDLYDLRFRLEFILDSEGFVGPIEIGLVRLEVIFFDQVPGDGSVPRPVRVLPFQVRPRREWVAGEKQTLSLNYSVPRGYFRSKAIRYGTGYSYYGIVAKLFFRGEIQDRMPDPPALASEAGQS